MTALSRTFIDKRLALDRRLTDGYAWHRALWLAFPDRPDANRDFLFRIDDQQDCYRALLLSQCHPTSLPWCQWETKDIREAFLRHSSYAFQLRANPTVKRSSRQPDGTLPRQGRRTGILGEPELGAWLLRKATRGGFAIDMDELVVGPAIREHFVRPPGVGAGSRRGTHVRVDYQGHLTVTAPDLFAQTFHRGIGSAKAFGFGMLMLEPLPSSAPQTR